ncbi:MAG: hypothetical protein H0V54_03975 [Chthoniobacterales bacterium]|nr:hypothetical protein [Chthoniobacterales bacterium]
MKLLHATLVAAISCGFAAASAHAGSGHIHRGAPVADSGLVIKRAADFGNQSNISLFINRHRVYSLGYGRTYRGTFPAGLHLVTMKQTPHLNDAYAYSQQWIRLIPGETSTFPAIWRGGGTRIALEGS